MAVDCKGSFGWCPSNSKIQKNGHIEIDESTGNLADKCLALSTEDFTLHRFNCEKEFIFACEVLLAMNDV